jgi:hypothetical protein
MMEVEGLSMSDVTKTNLSLVSNGCEAIFDQKESGRKLYVLIEEASGVLCEAENGPSTCVLIQCLNKQVG